MAQWVVDTPSYGNEHAGKRRNEKYLRLDNNENTGPLPSAVRTALKAAVDERIGEQARPALYPDEVIATQAIAAYIRAGARGIGGWPGCTEGNVLLTNGCDQAIDLVVRAYCTAATTVLVLRPTFPMYAHYLRSTGATPEPINYAGHGTNFDFPAEQLLRRAGELRGTRTVVLLANPDNPSGTSVPPDFIGRLREVNPDALLIVDEAYFEFCPHYSLLPQLSDDDDNVIILRSMSKCFGMAGLRLGFIIASTNVISGRLPTAAGSPAVGYLRKTRGPYDVNELALVTACAHLGDLRPTDAYVDDVMTKGRLTTIDWLNGAGVAFAPGAANFCLVQCTQGLEDLNVRTLEEQGVLVRGQSFPAEADRPGEWFRMSYPRSSELDVLATALRTCGVPL
jgi:histidinol-phosphate aminotransferase